MQGALQEVRQLTHEGHLAAPDGSADLPIKVLVNQAKEEEGKREKEWDRGREREGGRESQLQTAQTRRGTP